MQRSPVITLLASPLPCPGSPPEAEWQKTRGRARTTAQSKWRERPERYLKEPCSPPPSAQSSSFSFLHWVLIALRLQVIREAGEREIKVSTKSSTVDLVTKTDERVEKIIIGALKEEFGEGAHW